MSQRDPGLLSTPVVTLERGMSSGVDPRLIAPTQNALLINTTVRGGFPRNRPGWTQIGLVYDSESDQTAVESGRFQGAGFYQPRSGAPCLIACISGRQWRFNLWTDNTVQEVTIDSDPNPSNRLQVWFVQAEDFLLMQDGQSGVWCYNGGSARRLGVGELPVGCMMTYALGRVWIASPDRFSFVAGDLTGSSSGTPQYNYRDAVLKFTENDFLNEGGAFAVPVDAGQINSIQYVATLDSSLGQGPIEIFTDNGAFSVNAPFDRTIWKQINYPIQTVSLACPGALSQWSTVRINGDLWYRGSDGIRSFISARRDFTTWGNVSMSEEMQRLLRYDTDWMLPWSSAVTFDNRLLMTATPVWDADRGVAHRALAVLDFDLISSIYGRTQPAWDGMWTGLDILQLIVGNRNKVQRCFAFTLDDGAIKLWELSTSNSFDQPYALPRKRIQWGGETRLFDYDQPNTLKSLERADIAPSGIEGTVDFTMSYRSDENPCWLDWSTFSICANDSNCTTEVGECWSPEFFNKTFRTRVTLPTPPVSCVTSNNTPSQLGYRHQLRWQVLGPCTIKQMVLYARDVQQTPMDGCPPTNPTCTTENCCPVDNYLQSEV